MKLSLALITGGILSMLVQSCGETTPGSRTLPASQGKEYTVTVVVEGALETDAHIKALYDALCKPYPMTGLSPEPYFSLRFMEVKNFGDMTERDRYIIFLANTKLYGDVSKMAKRIFSGNAMENILTNPDKFMVVGHDVWSSGQEVMYLGAEDKEDLAAKIRANADNILNLFHEREFKRIQYNLYKRNEQVGRSKELFEKHKVRLRLPEAFNPAVMAISKDSVCKGAGVDGFEWYALDAKKSLSNIMISYKPYKDTSQLSVDSVVANRNAVGRFVPCEVAGSYLGTEMDEVAVAPQQRVLNLNGHYVVETLGWWDCQNAVMAGPFVNYAVIDKKGGRIVYLDGFIAAKGQPKKKYLIRLKAVLQTIDF